MADIDAFNGDADGLCALHQWRMAYPAEARLITGVKRRIDLLSGLQAGAGDALTVFDVSFDTNRGDAVRLLDAGVAIRWFDHHFAGEIPSRPRLQATIDTAADVCTSLLVDRALAGRYRPWAVAAAFGDNLGEAARRLAGMTGLAETDIAALAELGELLNYNGYGDSVADLHFPPEELFAAIRDFPDPRDFIAASPAFRTLRQGFRDDMTLASQVRPCFEMDQASAFLLPDEAWARRVVGVLANRLANASPLRAHALLVPNAAGDLTVSVRAPKSRPEGADMLCRQFATGGGRKAAAGINHLPVAEIQIFFKRLANAFT